MAIQQRVLEGVEQTANQLHNRKQKSVSKFRLKNNTTYSCQTGLKEAFSS